MVQADYATNTNGGRVISEQHVSFGQLKQIRQKSGRMDLFIFDEADDYVTIIEIKATDWDRIKDKNIKRNLWRHSRQLYRYIDKFMKIDGKDVCLAIVYPEPPKKDGLKELIENSAIEQYSFPVYWYSEIKTGTDH